MNQSQDMIQRYALLQCVAENSHARGQLVDPRVTSEMQRIENFAKVRMTPAQQREAMHHVEVAKMHIKQHEKETRAAHVTAYTGAKVDRMSRELTRNVDPRGQGFTRAQVAAIARGEPIPSDAPKRLTQSERDAAVRDRTRWIDPAGVGWSEAEYERRMDALADAEPGKFESMAKSYKADPAQLRKAATQWRHDRIEHGLMKRAQARDQHNGLKPSDAVIGDSERRRAVLADAVMEHTADEIEHDTRQGHASRAQYELEHSVSPELLNETNGDGELSRRAHIARAIDSQEQAGFSEE